MTQNSELCDCGKPITLDTPEGLRMCNECWAQAIPRDQPFRLRDYMYWLVPSLTPWHCPNCGHHQRGLRPTGPHNPHKLANLDCARCGELMMPAKI